MGLGGPPGGGLGPPGMGGPPGGDGGPKPPNKIQKVRAADVWEALRKSLKSKDDGHEEKGRL